jgi:ATP-binding cassette subfamily B protein
MVLIVKKLSYRIFQRSLSAQEELATLTSRAEESLAAIRLIRSCCREEYFEQTFDQTAERYLHFNLRIARLRGFIIPVMATATGAGTLITLFMGGRLVIEGVLTLGDFVAFGGYLAMLVWPTAIMGWIISLAQRGAASMSRLAEILEAEPEIKDFSDAVTVSRLSSGIELRNVAIEYDEKKLLDGISFFIASGEIIVISGDVGSFKSTLLRMIVRLMPAADGMIFLDGTDIYRISLTSLHSLIGYVPQEALLFSRSIKENIAFGAGSDVHADIEQAAAKAGFLDDISRLSEGMNTVVGEKGITLSGGQKQRLSIARALAGEPQVLLLDDPLSAVDAGKEEEILHQLGIFFQKRTVLVVSQRVSVFRECDRVIVLKEGKIIEQGSPAKLLESGGLYAEMYQTQQLREELG